MMLQEENDILNEAYKTCLIHIGRLNFSYQKIEHFFPLTIEVYNNIDDNQISFFDQFIYRFTKFQDAMGAKLFKSILDNLGEDVRAVPFIDILNKLESLCIISSAEDWLLLREIRNLLTHEYPFNKQEIVDGLNLLHKNFDLLMSVWKQTETYILLKFTFLMKE